MKYVHTNIISSNWKELARFYIQAFDCKLLLPQRDLSGQWLAQGTAVPNAHIKGAHLRLPGYGKNGPTLEIFEYHKMEEQTPAVSNRKGFGHLAFEVDNVQEVMDKALTLGGQNYGQIAKRHIDGLGTLTFVYIKDPEGNIIEIQHWDRTTTQPTTISPTAEPKPKTEQANPSLDVAPKSDSTPTVLEEEDKVYKNKRDLLDALQNDLDSSKQDLFSSKTEIKQSREEAQHQVQKVQKKLQYDPDASRDIPKTKQELLAELKQEMQGAELHTAIPNLGTTPATPSKNTIVLPPVQLHIEIKTAQGVQPFSVEETKLSLPSQTIAKNLNAFTQYAHPEDAALLLIEWIGKTYKADLVPLLKQYNQKQNSQEKEKAWALLPRLRDSLKHLLGKCKDDPEALTKLQLEHIGLHPEDFISTYNNLLTIVSLAEAEGVEYIRFAYLPMPSQ